MEVASEAYISPHPHDETPYAPALVKDMVVPGSPNPNPSVDSLGREEVQELARERLSLYDFPHRSSASCFW